MKPLTKEVFVSKANIVHDCKYDYSKVQYVNARTKVCIICPKHGEFWQTPHDHLTGRGCPFCKRETISSTKLYSKEKFVEKANVVHDWKYDYSKSDYVDSKTKICIICPKHGEFWQRPSNHLEGQGCQLCNSKSTTTDFICKAKERYGNAFSYDKVYARKCKLKNVSVKDKNLFLNENHIQGMSNSSVNLGLYYNDELVSLMTFGKPRINMGGDKTEGSWELVRFVSKKNTVVVGGANKLFKWFIEHYKPHKVISYSDNRWAKGNVYSKLGFAHDHDSAPNYFYVVSNKRENRFKYRKDRLVAEGYDKNKTEHEIMLERKIYRIYDCGCKAWIWKNEEKK